MRAWKTLAPAARRFRQEGQTPLNTALGIFAVHEGYVNPKTLSEVHFTGVYAGPAT